MQGQGAMRLQITGRMSRRGVKEARRRYCSTWSILLSARHTQLTPGAAEVGLEETSDVEWGTLRLRDAYIQNAEVQEWWLEMATHCFEATWLSPHVRRGS